MNKLEFNLWLLVLHPDKSIELMNHSYEYKYHKEEITELLLNKYKYYPLNLVLDKRYEKEFKLIHSTEDISNANYQTLDIGINFIRLNNKLIYKGDIEGENNR